MKDNYHSFIDNSENSQEFIGKENPWMSKLLVYLSLLILIGFFFASCLITYKGRSLLEILSSPMLRYIETLN